MSHGLVLSIALAVSFLVAGCGKDAPQLTPADFVATLHSGDALSAEECRAAGDAFVAALRNSNEIDLRMLFDCEALIDAALTGIASPGKDRDDFRTGATSSMRSSLLQNYRRSTEGGAGIAVLRVDEKANPPIVRLRNATADGFNYIEFHLARRNGVVKIIDSYDWAMGAKTSETIRRMALPFFAEREQQSFLDKLTGADIEFMKNLPAMQRFTEAVSSQNSPAVLSAYDALPEGLRSEKWCMLHWVLATSSTGEPAYIAALQKFRDAFPGDPNLDLMSIDFFFLQRNFDEVMTALDRIDAAVGGDPFLDSYRATCKAGKGDIAEARRLYEKTVAALPDLLSVHNFLLSHLVATADFVGVRKQLELMQSKFSIDLVATVSDPAYADFVASDVYRQWRIEGGPVVNSAPVPATP